MKMKSVLPAALWAACSMGLIGGNAHAASDEGFLNKVQKQAGIAAQVPAAIRDKGSITIVMTTSSPPGHFTTSHGMDGLDKDVGLALAKALGLKPNIVGVPLDQVIPGLQAHRYDVVVSQFKATPERSQVLDFVDYAQSGTALGTLAGNPSKLSNDNLCGFRIGVQKGSSQAVGQVPELSRKCVAEGRKPLVESTFVDSTTALLALRSHRIDGVLIDFPVMGYAAKQSPEVMTVGGPISANPVGIGALKGSDLAKPIQAALQYLRTSGAYGEIFDKWGLSNDEISNFQINNVQSN